MSEPPSADPQEMAVFIERMTNELRTLAASSGLDMLAYLLDVARAEAAAQAVDRNMGSRRAGQ